MLMRRPLTILGCVAIIAGGLAGCGAAPQAPGSQAATAAAPAVEGAATAVPALLATGAAVATAVGDPTVVALAATSAAQAGSLTTSIAATAAVLAPTAVAVAPTALGAVGSAVAPETVAAAVSALTTAQGIAPEAISVVSVEQVAWPDGSLGCPKPGMMYPQVITEGYLVVLAADGKEYALHGDDRGQFFYCESPAR